MERDGPRARTHRRDTPIPELRPPNPDLECEFRAACGEYGLGVVPGERIEARSFRCRVREVSTFADRGLDRPRPLLGFLAIRERLALRRPPFDSHLRAVGDCARDRADDPLSKLEGFIGGP